MLLDTRALASSIWSPRSEGAAQEMSGYPGRLLFAPSASLPTRHSKSLDQLGPELTTSPTLSSQYIAVESSQGGMTSSAKTLPRSVSIQLLGSKQQQRTHNTRNVTPPSTVPSRSKQRSIAPSCTSLFPPLPMQQACSAPNPSLGM